MPSPDGSSDNGCDCCDSDCGSSSGLPVKGFSAAILEAVEGEREGQREGQEDGEEEATVLAEKQRVVEVIIMLIAPGVEVLAAGGARCRGCFGDNEGQKRRAVMALSVFFCFSLVVLGDTARLAPSRHLHPIYQHYIWR